jgi:hypothetical protein
MTAPNQAITVHNEGTIRVHEAKREAAKAYVAAVVDPFLNDTQSPFAKIVPARVVTGESRRRAR